jgi:hypothetical protein
MPAKKGYTKAQKAAFAKTLALRRKKPATKAAVAAVRRKKVELKDRISAVPTISTMYQNSIGVQPFIPSAISGPANSQVIVPNSWKEPFTNGTENGQIVGTEITPKYLNLKLKMGFDFLRRVVFMGPNGTDPHVQRYDINIIQGWVMKDLRDEIDRTLVNANSGWTLPSFESKAAYDAARTSLLKQEFYNSMITPEFLSYRQKTATNIRIIKRIKVKGHQDENLVTDSASELGVSPAQDITPEQNFTFDWDLSKFNKTKLTPVGTGTQKPTHVFGYTWIPFVQVLVARRVVESRGSHTGGDPSAPAEPELHRSYLTLKSVDHFTYADS